VSFAGLHRLPLEMHVLAFLLGRQPLRRIGLDAVNELLSAPRVFDVFDANVDALFEVSVAYSLVDDDAERRLGDVVHDTSLAMVDLVRHTLLDSAVCLDINNITDVILL